METDDRLKLSLKDDDGSLIFAFDRDGIPRTGSSWCCRYTTAHHVTANTAKRSACSSFSTWFVLAIPAGVLPGWWDLWRLPEQTDEINVGSQIVYQFWAGLFLRQQKETQTEPVLWRFFQALRHTSCILLFFRYAAASVKGATLMNKQSIRNNLLQVILATLKLCRMLRLISSCSLGDCVQTFCEPQQRADFPQMVWMTSPVSPLSHWLDKVGFC